MSLPSRELIDEAIAALIRFDGHFTNAAASLGIHRTSLRDRLRYADRFGIEIPFPFRDRHRGKKKISGGNGWVVVGRTVRGDGSIASTIEKPEPTLVPIEIPDPKRIKFTTTVYDREGRPDRQFVRLEAEKVALGDFIRETITKYLDGCPPIGIPAGPNKFDTDIVAWFQIGDAHLGMLAHETETGANFDLKIAEKELCTAFAALFDECPARERGVINDLGDGTHYENLGAVTEASGHRLDADGRYPKMIGTYTRTMRFIIDRALGKFPFVDVIINQGNHSRVNDMWMAELLRQVYGQTNRVNILDNSSVFIPYRMGNTFVMVHHGDKTKPARLAQVMSTDFRQDWGEAEYRYIDVGHLHHKWVAREDWGCQIEMWNSLCGKDRWTHDAGYRSHQSITRVDRSKTYGEVGRRVLPIKEIRNIISGAYIGSYIPPERRLVFTV